MSISNYLEVELLDHIVGGGSRDWSPPAAIYVKLHTGDPGEAGTANASAETDRKGITSNTEWGPAGSGTVATTTNGDVTWTAWDAGAETISWISLWDDPTAGNCLWAIQLTAPRSVTNGDTFTIPAGDLSLSLD